ncbi:male sterility protein-domain-containing protein [Blyttiomyces helicus]|uniref:Male sterility protein-domain-containing protein n=1 Tax=Blyttiomyces helicus TaxID=388810 RepID=A0A4P9WPN8_9FUNG|nr:male sterility protein-domain-containing protein [Blyttiomyces helicus]|eukprot:RKO93708.1 male sterility protein-domain-containing protein [Blyttiomyces helicus]
MPLNPNGKIDKNALPFPDTALAPVPDPSTPDESNLSPLQLAIREIWARVLNIPASTISLPDNFFDLGGHSILATRLVFEIRKTLAVQVPLGLVYREPTIAGMAREVDFARGGDLNLERGTAETKRARSESQLNLAGLDAEVDYAAELEAVDDQTIAAAGLPPFSFPSLAPADHPVFFLTGATGFLGAFILDTLLRRYSGSKVVTLVRAPSPADALQRLRDNGERHLVWEEDWVTEGRVEALCGDLGSAKFGFDAEVWEGLAKEVDIIVHNGALVHWVYPYHKLYAPNVLGTLTSLRLATLHHLKPLHFISSTSVLDTDHYVRMLTLGDEGRVRESDDLEGSRRGLRSGYGQTKWVAEKLIMRARQRGVPATIVRPGYIVGESKSGGAFLIFAFGSG